MVSNTMAKLNKENSRENLRNIYESAKKLSNMVHLLSTITNLQSQRSTFVVGASSFQSWATLTGISERVLQLNPGESKDITFTFEVNKDEKGEQTFSIETISNEQSNQRLLSK